MITSGCETPDISIRKVRGKLHPFVVVGAESCMSSKHKCVPDGNTQFKAGDVVHCETYGDGRIFVFSPQDPEHRETWKFLPEPWMGI